MISCVIVTQVTKHDKDMTSITVWLHTSQSHVTSSHDIEKNINGFRIDNVI